MQLVGKEAAVEAGVLLRARKQHGGNGDGLDRCKAVYKPLLHS